MADGLYGADHVSTESQPITDDEFTAYWTVVLSWSYHPRGAGENVKEQHQLFPRAAAAARLAFDSVMQARVASAQSGFGCPECDGELRYVDGYWSCRACGYTRAVMKP